MADGEVTTGDRLMAILGVGAADGGEDMVIPAMAGVGVGEGGAYTAVGDGAHHIGTTESITPKQVF